MRGIRQGLRGPDECRRGFPVNVSPAIQPGAITPGTSSRSTVRGTTWIPPGTTPSNKGGDYIRYDYFLKSDYYMSQDHSDWSGSHDCTSTRYDGLDLSSTEEQIKQEQDQQEQAQFSAIRQVLEAAIAELPYQTQEELEGASYDDLMNARYAYVSLEESYSNLTLREAYQAMAGRSPGAAPRPVHLL